MHIRKRRGAASRQILGLRKKLHCTQKELAEIMGIHPETVSSWERGTHKPSGLAQAFINFLSNKSEEELENIRGTK